MKSESSNVEGGVKCKIVLKNMKKRKLNKIEEEDENLENTWKKSLIKSKKKVKPMISEFESENLFIQHFQRNITKDLAEDISNFQNWKCSTIFWPQLGEIKAKVPVISSVSTKEPKNSRLLLANDDDDGIEELPKIGIIPSPNEKMSDIFHSCGIDTVLNKNINRKKFSALQSEILLILSNYIDFNYTEITNNKLDKIKLVYSIHVLNHLLKAKKVIMENNKKLKENGNEAENSCLAEDQGFTKPKVLILLPFKNSAYKLIKMMITVYGKEVQNKKRFKNEFGPQSEDPNKGPKSKDFYETFAGNISEDFKIGIAVSKKCFKLYTEFFKSDIIVASPLALRHTLENAEGHNKEFLSSIEIFIMDQADVFLMQNWQHILYIKEEMNKMPKDFQALNFDIYRIRRWCYDDLSLFYRQTIIFGTVNSPLFLSYLETRKNMAGQMIVANPFHNILPSLSVQAELILQQVKTADSSENYSSNAQFLHFKDVIMPLLRKKNLSHVMIYIPDYFDYIQLVSYFKEDGGASVATINEYMIEENSKVAKARSLFFEGKKQFLLYTERFHFYRRYKIKGIRHIVFYSPPTYAHFFEEICSFMSAEYQNPKDNFEGINSIILPYQVPYDIIPLIRILGRDKMEEIFLSNKKIHLCITGIL